MNTILDYLEQHANLQGDREFLILQDERLTFAEFATRVKRLAGLLRARGVGPGERVVSLSGRRTPISDRYMVTMAAGAIPVHLYPERWHRILRKSRYGHCELEHSDCVSGSSCCE